MSQRRSSSQERLLVTRSDRLDILLGEIPSIGTRNQAQKLIHAACVHCNGKLCTKPSMRLKNGDVLTWSLLSSALSSPEKGLPSMDIDILYEDSDCWVMNKPAQMTIHPGAGTVEPTFLHFIEQLFADRHMVFSASQTLVHRLDRDTTGCLLVAKNAKAHRALQEQFARRSVQKSYLALVDGIPVPREAMIDAPIGRSTRHRTTMSVHHISHARPARTTYRTLHTSDGCALLICDLHTGRTHQLRVHLSAIGHSILGDETYGTTASIAHAEALGLQTIFLHAFSLSFTSLDDQSHRVIAPLPAAKIDILDRLHIPIPTL